MKDYPSVCYLCGAILNRGNRAPTKDEKTGVCLDCRQSHLGFDVIETPRHNEMKDRRSLPKGFYF